MNIRCLCRLFRIYLIISITSILFLWLSSRVFFYVDENHVYFINSYKKYFPKNIYSPPQDIRNWTINDYFLRKDKLKRVHDEFAILKKHKVIIENNFTRFDKEKKSNYVILEYTKVLGQPKFCGKARDFIFGEKCPYQNCRYTCDHNSIKYADVLLMHRSDINISQLKIERSPDQIWLFWHDEPGGVDKLLVPFKFNWTMSYRVNSEANIGAYGMTILRRKPLSSRAFDKYIDTHFHKRKSNAVWFVSNCKSKSRLDLYHKLKSFYPLINAYGQCHLNNQTGPCYRYSQCEYSELIQNKYYLSFESQSCRDYVTEKFWRTLAHGAIPIVYGPINKQSLIKIAPPNSFIYAGDFSSVSQLAEHLKDISRSKTLFSHYHRWRYFYRVFYLPEEIEKYRFCELCYRLNTNKDRIYYEDLNTFFLEDC